MEDINPDQFETSVLCAKEPVLVDVWAGWCGPCGQMRPEIEKAVKTYEGRATIVGIDADAYPELATQYNVASMPTLLLFKDGEVVVRTSGFHTAKQIGQLIESAL